MRIHEAAKERSVAALDAPVSGGDVGAREARLAIMVGGEQEVFDKVLPLFQQDGGNHRAHGRARGGPAHEDGEPDRHRGDHDRHRGIAPLRPQGGPGDERGDRHHRQGRRLFVVAEQPRTADRQGAISIPASTSSTS